MLVSNKGSDALLEESLEALNGRTVDTIRQAAANEIAFYKTKLNANQTQLAAAQAQLAQLKQAWQTAQQLKAKQQVVVPRTEAKQHAPAALATVSSGRGSPCCDTSLSARQLIEEIRRANGAFSGTCYAIERTTE